MYARRLVAFAPFCISVRYNIQAAAGTERLLPFKTRHDCYAAEAEQ